MMCWATCASTFPDCRISSHLLTTGFAILYFSTWFLIWCLLCPNLDGISVHQTLFAVRYAFPHASAPHKPCDNWRSPNRDWSEKPWTFAIPSAMHSVLVSVVGLLNRGRDQGHWTISCPIFLTATTTETSSQDLLRRFEVVQPGLSQSRALARQVQRA